VLFSAFPSSPRDDELLSLKTYLEALSGYSVEAIERSVEQFIRGLVATHDGRFAPSAAELARNVKQWDDVLREIAERRNTPPLASGIMNVDFGHGPIDMTRLTRDEQDEVLRTGKAPVIAIGDIRARLRRLGDKGAA
jgi:hypothetical protein